MAKWGEGDPRWIVEERPDAVNVNNWHWTEKDATKWSDTKMKELLVGYKMETDAIEVEITEMSKMEGEASVNNRKAKLIFLYDWNITLTWKGRLLNSPTADKSTGSINIPNLSDENSIDEVTVEVTLKDSTTEGEIIKQYLHMEGQKKIREQLSVYLKLLKEEFSKGVILPKKDAQSNQNQDKKQMNKLTEGFNQKVQMNTNEKKSSANSLGKAEFTTLNTSYNFQCTGEEFYNSLTDPRMVSAFTKSSVVLEPKVGGKFELFEGNISGVFVQLEPSKKIVKKWRLKSWPKDHYSEVSLTIDQQDDHTLVKLSQTGVPKGDIDMLKNNWQLYYWDSIKQTFGFGYFL